MSPSTHDVEAPVIEGSVTLVAYLCAGYPVAFLEISLLEHVGWRKSMPMSEVVSEESSPDQLPSGDALK